jgi:hypothetical protein
MNNELHDMRRASVSELRGDAALFTQKSTFEVRGSCTNAMAKVDDYGNNQV